jgi:hypothetical protein
MERGAASIVIANGQLKVAVHPAGQSFSKTAGQAPLTFLSMPVNEMCGYTLSSMLLAG